MAAAVDLHLSFHNCLCLQSCFAWLCRWGEGSQINETLSTCRFAMRLLRLKCRITPNVVEDAGTQIRALQR